MSKVDAHSITDQLLHEMIDQLEMIRIVRVISRI